MTHRATCRCGQLMLEATGDPVRVSVCHCLNCKKRSGSAFAAQVRFPPDEVTVTGQSKTFDKAGDSGAVATFHFCPECGSDVYYVLAADPDGVIAVPLGAFDDPLPFTPNYSVYEGRMHPWIAITGETIEHYD